MMVTPNLPVPISYIHGRYLLFDINVASYLRREHNIGGVLTGSLPQIPQQNVFLGLPLELMPEEVRVLADEGVAYVVDDVTRHDGVIDSKDEDRKQYLQDLKRQGRDFARIKSSQKQQSREVALRRAAIKASATPDAPATNGSSTEDGESNDSLFEPPASSGSSTPRASIDVPDLAVTPAISDTLLPPLADSGHIIKVPDSYPLFAHLHSKGYFISPGLRFGCSYMIYPGDPLRFHSHFLTVGYNWNEEIDLMDLVGGGRLGTGVKKGFLVGGMEQHGAREDADDAEVRTWSLEWAGM